MVRASKSSDKSSASAAASAPSVASTVKVEVVETTPVVEKPKKARATKAEKAVVEKAPVVAPVAEPAVEQASADESEDASSEPTTSSRLTKYVSHLKQVADIVSALRTEFKALEKSVTRDIKNAQKSSRKKKASGNRQPSGFTIPVLISDELARFLGKESGAKMARTEVSKALNVYIKANSLQAELNRRNINADAKLTTLLNLKKGDELSYFNLQRYLKHHFIKTEKATA